MKQVIGAVVTAVALTGTAFAQDVLTLRAEGPQIGVRVTDEDGVVIAEVSPNTPASEADLKPGDVVVEFDGERIRSASQFTRVVSETPPRKRVTMVVIRNGTRQSVSVTPRFRDNAGPLALWNQRDFDGALRRFRDNPNLNFRVEPRGGTPRIFGLAAEPQRLGVEVSPLSDQLAQYFGVKGGALVSSVDAGTPAAQAGLRSGDVITSINGEAVATPADVSARVRGAAEGATLELRVMRDRKELTLKAVLPSTSPRPGRI